MVGVGRRRALHRIETLRLVSGVRGWRTFADAGTLQFSTQRLRFRSERERRRRRGLADSLSQNRTFGYEGGAGRGGWSPAVAELGVGGGFKDAIAEPGQWTIGGTAFGEMLPNHANRVTLEATVKDKWGLPVLRIDCTIGENDTMMRKDMIADMAEMLSATDVRDVKTFDEGYVPGQGIHEMGTARMGRD